MGPGHHGHHGDHGAALRWWPAGAGRPPVTSAELDGTGLPVVATAEGAP